MRHTFCRTVALCAALPLLHLVPAVVAPRTPPVESAFQAIGDHLLGGEDEAAAHAIDTSGMEQELWQLIRGNDAPAAASHANYQLNHPDALYGQGGHQVPPFYQHDHQAAPSYQHDYPYAADHGASFYHHAGQEMDYGHPQPGHGYQTGTGYGHHQAPEHPLSIYDYADLPEGVVTSEHAHLAILPDTSGQQPKTVGSTVIERVKNVTPTPPVPKDIIEEPAFETAKVNRALRTSTRVEHMQRIMLAPPELQGVYLRHYREHLLATFPGELVDRIHFVRNADLVFPANLAQTFKRARYFYFKKEKGDFRIFPFRYAFGRIEEPLHLQDYVVNAVVDPARTEGDFCLASVIAQHHDFASKDKYSSEYRRFYLGELRIPKQLLGPYAKDL
ncbi:uncharacterized protein PFL1_02763 [Pseudozyma flocculosa PF-1]|uniref:Uncharacterized protein n=1 Tax=Pseudozyma flocculosa PF-1 TaxID=1277687 RepID=A0A061HAT2_9BASI|nr:uncharacterized protein PFL1_02763 [Pseudozyma flocculosa PF-1]EPQ29544.1 hypothetical protein PFL1_02763 [Pseudozyma flocculosa PF-1]